MRLYREEDYVYSRRFEYSLTKLLERYPDGAPDSLIAAVLLIPETDIEPNYSIIVAKLREHMRVDE